MSAELQQNEALVTPPRVPPRSYFMKAFFGRKVVIFGMAVLLLLVIVAIFAPLISPYDPYATDLEHSLAQPSAQHWLGTDNVGRDILSRVIFGSRISLMVGFIAIGIGACIGTMLGLIGGYYGGIISAIIMRFVDALMTVPMLLLALAITAVMGGGLVQMMIALGIALIPGHARLTNSMVLTIKQSEFVLASKAMGASNIRIMLRNIFPNSMPPLIVMVTQNLGLAILSEAGLSFLGLGLSPPSAAWGSMVNEGYRYLHNNVIYSTSPGVCIMLVVLAFNIVGDGLRDALDPRLRGTI
jgi:peptide/nickel transport system permease protein